MRRKKKTVYPKSLPGFPGEGNETSRAVFSPFFFWIENYSSAGIRPDAGTGLTQFIATKISCVAISSRRLTGSRRDEDTRQAGRLPL